MRSNLLCVPAWNEGIGDLTAAPDARDLAAGWPSYQAVGAGQQEIKRGTDVVGLFPNPQALPASPRVS